jgi:purine-binding chemotaxis protein CheW
MRETAEVRQEMGKQVLSFAAGGTEYGIPILKVREILQYEGVTQVPSAPPSVRGVTNVRGTAVPVLDLAAKLGRDLSAPTNRSCVLVVDVVISGERLTLGVFADAVNEVVDLPTEDIEPPPTFGGGAKVSYLTGLGKVGRRFILLLDLDRIASAADAELAAELPPTTVEPLRAADGAS